MEITCRQRSSTKCQGLISGACIRLNIIICCPSCRRAEFPIAGNLQYSCSFIKIYFQNRRWTSITEHNPSNEALRKSRGRGTASLMWLLGSSSLPLVLEGVVGRVLPSFQDYILATQESFWHQKNLHSLYKAPERLPLY